MKNINMHKTREEIMRELTACTGCQECLRACPAITEAIPIHQLNQETLSGPPSPAVARFARDCSLCGACIPVCPVGLDRSAMMLMIKVQLMG